MEVELSISDAPTGKMFWQVIGYSKSVDKAGPSLSLKTPTVEAPLTSAIQAAIGALQF